MTIRPGPDWLIGRYVRIRFIGLRCRFYLERITANWPRRHHAVRTLKDRWTQGRLRWCTHSHPDDRLGVRALAAVSPGSNVGPHS